MFLFWISISIVTAQPLCKMKVFGVNDGYTLGSINDILQDHKGVMWASSRDGLTQFNGYTFTNYKSYPGENTAMGTSNIGSITENSIGDIWCTNQDGRVYLFDTKAKQFYDILAFVETEKNKLDAIDQVITLKKGVTWLILKNGLTFRVEDALCKSGKGISSQLFKDKQIFRIRQDTKQNEWILTDKGTYIFGNPHKISNTPFKHISQVNNNVWLSDGKKAFGKFNPSTNNISLIPLPTNINHVTTFRSLRNKNLAMGTHESGLVIFDTQNETFEQISVVNSDDPSNQVYRIYEDKEGDFWISNSNPGIIHLKNKTNKVQHLQSPPNTSLRKQKQNRFMVTEDNFGYLWVIPNKGNLCYFDRKTQQLKYYYSEQGDKGTLISPNMPSNFTDKQGNIWFDNNVALGKLSFYGQNFKLIPNKDDEFEVRSLLLDPHKNVWVGIKNNRLKILDEAYNCIGYLSETGQLSESPIAFKGNIYCMLLDHQKNIWLGTRNNGIFLFKPENSSQLQYSVTHFKRTALDNFSINSNSIYALYQDSQLRIWVGTYDGGLNLVEKQKDSKYRFIHSNNLLKNYPIQSSSGVRHITEVKPNHFLVASTKGLISFSGEFDRPEEIDFYRNIRQSNKANSLTNNDIFYVYKDHKNHSFALVENGGINQITSQNIFSDNIEFDSFTERNGLISDLTLSMIEDNSHNLWLISIQGLSQYYPTQKKVDHHTEYLFRKNILFTEASPIINASGNLLIGSNKGIVEFNPQKTEKETFTPNIIFTDIALQGVNILEDVEEMGSLLMQPDQRNLSVQFAALDYQDSKTIKYAYKMEGIDEGWHYAGPYRSASYINLSPGTYRLLVKSTNSNGIWVDNIRTLHIKVKPKFIETFGVWVLVSLGVILLLGITIFVMFTFYRLKYAVEMEKKLTHLKLKFFTDVSHELRTPLTLISSPLSDVLEVENLSTEGKEHLNIVKKNTERMLRMVNQILDFRKVHFNKMKLLVEHVEMIAFTRHIMDGFRGIAKDKNILFTLDSNTDEIDLWIDKDKFEKIMFNLISNAFKYTSNGKCISIQLLKKDEDVNIIIEDEGIGMVPKKTALLFQRFETLLQSDVYNNSTGIGLSLVKELVELHHGKIEVKSKKGEGSSFTVTMPLNNQHLLEDNNIEFLVEDSNFEEEEQHPQEQVEPTPENSDEKWSLLIIEDNTELRTFLKNVLSRSYKVYAAINGIDGIEQAKKHVPDLIISDVMMPLMDGLEMIQHIKNNKELSHIPIILLSAKSSLDDRIKGLENGIDDYITKPFGANYLKTRIQSLIKQRHLLQQLYLSNITSPKENAASKSLSPAPPQISTHDEIFVQQLMEFMEKNMDNTSLAVDDFSTFFNISRSVLFKKMKMLLGVTPVGFIRDMRIKRAVQLMDSGLTTVADIAYRCGFGDPNYFAKCFKKQMGISPSDYKKK